MKPTAMPIQSPLSSLIGVALALLTSCASLRPLAQAPAPDSGSALPSAIELRAVEGRPQGLVLRLTSAMEELDRVELYRVVGASKPELLESIEVDASVQTALARGVEIIDGAMTPGSAHAYQAVAVADGALAAESAIVDVEWRDPPARPTTVRARAPLPDAVELSWVACHGCGAMIFRRDVLADGPFERLAAIAAGRAPLFVDRDVRPGGVWSYRVALAKEAEKGGLVQYGPLSEEVYASTPVDEP